MTVGRVKKIKARIGAGAHTPDDPVARFWQYVNKNGPVIKEELGECWVWTAARMKDGYGLYRFEGKLEGAHRFSYILEHGPIPTEQFVMHLCDNPPCVRPSHLMQGTNAENLGDMAAKGRARGGRKTKDGREPKNRRKASTEQKASG